MAVRPRVRPYPWRPRARRRLGPGRVRGGRAGLDEIARRTDDRQRAWLLGTLANKDISDFRRREAFRRRQPDIQARYQATAADTAAQALNAIALERAREIIEEMPPRQRTVALMRWQDRMKAAEIAAELGVAEGTVHAHLHSARGKLVAGLERYYPFGTDSGKGAAS